VPLQISFMDANWNIHTEEISMSGDTMYFNFQIPVNPVFVGINLNERVNDATTAVTKTISSVGLKDYPYANARLNVNTITDSVFIRIEHNWVSAGFNGTDLTTHISQQRYWNIHGIINPSFDATMRFEYNGQLNNGGYYDHELLTDIPGQTFIEDSIVLLYRPDANSLWTEHPDYTLNFTGTNLDKKGFATVNSFMFGQYTWGYKTNTVGVSELSRNQNDFNLYPNPAFDMLNIDLSDFSNADYQIKVYDLKGNVLFDKWISNTLSQLNISGLANGVYLINVYKENSILGTKRLVIQR